MASSATQSTSNHHLTYPTVAPVTQRHPFQLLQLPLAREVNVSRGGLFGVPARQRVEHDETLLVWGGEFDRTPMVEIRKPEDASNAGRDHHPDAYSMWMAGGGFKGGHIAGKTDEFCLKVLEDPIHVHDLQATMLHCLGFEHTKLTYRYMGRDFRLTGVAGKVAPQLLA